MRHLARAAGVACNIGGEVTVRRPRKGAEHTLGTFV
eukprot:gene15826-34813_t